MNTITLSHTIPLHFADSYRNWDAVQRRAVIAAGWMVIDADYTGMSSWGL